MNTASPALAFIRRTLRVPVTAFLLASFSLWSTQIRGATVYWDANTSTSGLQDGGGTWNAGDLVFWSGNTNIASANSITTDLAHFGFGGTGGTINVGTQSITGLIFGATTGGGYTLTNSAASTLTLGTSGILLSPAAQATTVGSSNLTLAMGAAQTWTNHSAGLLTIGGNVTGTQNLVISGAGNTTFLGGLNNVTGTLVKTGAGTLTFGAAASSGTGSKTIRGGTLSLDFSAGALTSNILGPTSPLTLNGGTLQISGRSGATVSQTLGALTNSTGESRITMVPNSGTSTTLILGTATTLNATGSSLLVTAPSATTVQVTTTNVTNSIYGAGHAVFYDGTSYNWLSNTGGATPFTLSGLGSGVGSTPAYTGALSATGGGVNTGNYTLTGGQTQSTAASTLGTLKISSSIGSTQTLDLNGFNMSLGQAGLLFAGTDAYNINATGGGTLTGGTDLVIHQYGTNVAGMTINAGLSGASNLVKAGPGLLTLGTAGGANALTGQVYVNAGTLSFSSVTAGAAGSLGNGSATAVFIGDGATLQYAGSTGTIAATGAGGHTYTLMGGNSTIDVTTAGQTLTLSGAIGQTSGSVGGLTKTGAGILSFNTGMAYTGPTIISQGTLLIAAADRINDASALTIASGATFDMVAGNETVGSLSGAGTIAAGGGTARTLGLGGDNLSTTFTGAMTGAVAHILNKSGSGVLTLGMTTQSTWTGNNSILGGTIRFAADNQFANGTQVVVGLGAGFTSWDLNGFNQTVNGANALNFYGTGATATSSAHILLGGGTITLGGGIVYNNNGNPMASTLTATGAGGISLTGTRTITVRDSTGVAVGSPELTISAPISATGAFGLSKSGLGAVMLGGSNTFTGTTTVNAGTLMLDYTVNNNDKISSTGVLDLRGGVLVLNGNASAATTQSVASFTLAGGNANSITVNSGTGQSATLNLGAITRAVNQGTIRFNLPASGAITTTNANNNVTANGILGGWATVNTGSGTFFARNDGSGPPGSIVASAVTLQDTITSWVAGDNVSDSSGFTGTLVDCISINSLRFNAAGPSTVTLPANGALVFTSGGILQTSNVTAGTSAITGGSLLSGTGELIFTVDSASQILNVGSTIGGTTTITKTGNGILRLSGTNRNTGALLIQSGNVQLTGGSAIADTSAVTLGTTYGNTAGNPTLTIQSNETIGSLSGGATPDGGITSGLVALGSNTLTINQTSALTYNGLFSGNGVLVKTGSAALTLAGTTATGFDGTVIVNQGQLIFTANTGTLSSVTAFTINGTGELLVDNNNGADADSIGNGVPITLNNTNSSNGLFVRTNQGNTKTEDVGAVLLGEGFNTITSHGSATNATSDLLMDSLTRTGRATGLVRGNALGTSATQRSLIRVSVAGGNTALDAEEVGGGTDSGTQFKIIPWLVGSNSQTGVGNSFVTNVSATLGVRPLDIATEYVVDQTPYDNLGAGVLNDNVRFTTTTGTLASDTTGINSLILDSATGITVTGPGQGLEITSGALLSASAGANILTGFTGITTGGTRDYNVYVTTAGASLTLTSPLTSAVPLVKSGAGSLILSSASNAFTDLYLQHGIVQTDALNKLGSGALIFSGGTLRFAGVFDPSGKTITIGGGGATIDTNGNPIVFTGSLGSGSGTFTKAGAGSLTLAATSTLTGGTVVAAGSVIQGANQAIGTGDLSVTAGATLDLGAFNTTVGNVTLPNSATVSLAGTGTLTASGTMTVNQAAVSPTLAGSFNLIKQTASQTVALTSASSSFTGFTHIQDGTLSTVSLANAGSNSSLGAPTGQNAVIRIGNGASTTATLLYTGPATSTDRGINLTGTTGGATIDNDGTGALTLTGDIHGAELGAKTLTLQGATTGFSNILAGSIDECMATLALTKAEAGTWVLNNANIYTGITTITLGTLQVNTATGGLGNSVAVNAINLNGGTLSLRNNGAGNNGSIIYGSTSNPSGYKVQLSATSTINVDNLTANTGNTIALGPLTQASTLARTLNVTGGNGYTLTLASFGLNPGTGQTNTLVPTTASLIIAGTVTNPMTGFTSGNFDTLVLDGTSTGNEINGVISDAVGGSIAAGGTTRITKSNTSTWTLNGNNLYAGNTSLNGGVLIAGTDTAFGTSVVTFGGGTLNNQDENRTFANDFAINATTATLTGTGDFNFNGNLSQTGGSRIFAINNTGVTTFGNASTDTITLAENSQARTLTFNVASTASVIVNSTLQDGTGTGADGIIKTGTGDMTINTAATYTGTTTVDNGTLTLAANQNLAATTNTLILGAAAATTTPVTLDLTNASATFGGAMTMNINSATASTIEIGATKTLTINNNVQIGATSPAVALTVTKLDMTGGGTFNVATAAGGSFIVGGSTSGTNAADTTLDLSDLSATTINTSATGTFRVNNSNSANIAGSKATLYLPTPAVADTAATTTITTNNFNVGDSATFNSAAGQINSVYLGTGLTTINANNINVGTGGRDIGQIIFAAAGGDLKIRAADGTSRITAFNVATGGATTGTTEPSTKNLVDFTGHDADLLIGTLNIGNQARIGSLISDFKFDTGTLDATSVNIGFRTGAATTTTVLTSNVSIGGGNVTFGNAGATGTGVDIGNSTYNAAGASGTNGALNISGGNVMIHNSTALGAAMRLGTNATAVFGLDPAALNLTGGTTTFGGHIIRNATSPRTTSSVLLNGATATLDMGGFNIGSSASPIAFDVRQGTLRNLGEFNSGATLIKTTSGTLTMGGTNTYTGATVVQDGLVIAEGGGNNRLSTTGLTLGNLTASAVLQLGNGAGPSNQTLNQFETSGTGTGNAVVGGATTNSTFTVNQTGTYTYEGRLGGAGANQNNLNFVKGGAGTLVLTGNNTYTGSTSVTGGSLLVDTITSFPSGGNTSLTVADGAEFSLRGSGLTSVQSYGFSGTGNVITLGSGTGTATLGFRLDGAFNTQLVLAAGQTMSVAAGATFQTAVYVDDAPIASQPYVLINGADAGSLHAGGGTFNPNPVIFNGGSFTYALTNVTLGGTVDRWVITPTAQAAAADVWWKGDLTGIGTGVWSASTTSGPGFPTNWDDSQAGGIDALVPPDSGSIVHFSATGAASFATTLGANLTIQELIFHAGGTAISVDGNSGLYTLTLGNAIDASGITLLTGAPNVSISADVALAQAQSFNITDAASTLTFSRGISGTGGLSINDNGTSTGTMIMSGVDGIATYTGPTNLVTGRLILNGGADNRLPTTTALTLGNATLGSVLQLGDAINGASNHTIGSLITGAAGTSSIVGGAATVSTLTFVQTTNSIFNGVIGGAGTNENNLAIIKSGPADFVLNGIHTYTGGTAVTNGLFKLGSTASITGAININAAAGMTATFDNNSRPTVLSGGITFGGGDSAAVPQLIDTGGLGSITLGGDIVYNGTNNPAAVSISLPLNLGAASRIFTANDSTTAATDLTIANTVSSTAGNVGVSGVGLTLDGTGSGLVTSAITLVNGTSDGAGVDLTKNGTGSWTIQNTVTVSDDYLINAGTFTVSGSGSLTWNATGSTSQDFVADTSALTANFNVANAIVGNSNTNRLFARDGATININATGALGGTIEQIILGDDNQGIGNVVLAAGTTNTLNAGTVQVGFNSSGEVGNITGTGTLNGITTLTLNNGIVSANLGGIGNITRDNNLTVTLSGNNALTGTTLNREGTLVLDFTTNAGLNNKIGTGAMTVGSTANNDATAITNLIGNASASSTQTVASLAVAGGPSQLNLSSSGQDMIFSVTGALTRTAGTLNVALPNANTQFAYSGPTLNTNGIVGAWLTLNDRDYATISGGQIVAATYTTQNNAALWHGNLNITNSGGGFTGTVPTDCNTINSLRFDAAGVSTITVANSFILSSGGLMVNASVGNNASTITGGTIASGLSTGELIVTQNNTANTFNIASRIINSAPITKNGTGTLILSGTNNQTGTINIDEGIIRVTGGSAISDTSTINIRNVANTGLEVAANQTETIGSVLADGSSSVIILNTGSTLTLNQNTAGTFAGIISGAGNLVKNGTAILTITGDASMTGAVTINAGRITLSGGSGRINDAASYALNGGELLLVQDQTTSQDRIRDTTTVTLSNTAGTLGLRLQNTNQNATRADNIGPLALGFGHNIITADAAAATGTTSVADLVADSLARGSNRATVLVSGLNLGSTTTTAAKGLIRLDAGGQTAINNAEVGGGASTGTNISIIPWIVGDITTAGLGNSFVTNVDGTTGLRPLATNEYINDSTAITGALQDNIRYTATAAITTTPTAINSLVLDSATAIALTGSASSMEITSGAILAAGAANHTIGTISGLTTGGARDYTVYVTTAGNSLTLNSPLTTAVPLVKSGAGNLILTSTSNAITDVYLNQGFVQVDDLDKLGTGSLIYAGGGLKLAAGFIDDLSTKVMNITTGGGTIDASLVTAGITLINGIDDSVVNSADTLTLITRSSATGSIGQITVQGSSTFTGRTVVNHSSINTSTAASVILNGNTNAAINGDLHIGSLGTITGTNDVVVQLAADEQIVDSASITFNSISGAEAYFKLLGRTETVAGITSLSRGVIENHESATDTVVANGKLIVNSSQDFSFTGFLRDRNSGTGGTLAFEKQGTGTQTLAGTSITYTGPTTISGGTLRLTDTTAFNSAINNNAELELNRTTGTWTLANAISGTGVVTKIGAGTIVLSGSNSYSGQTHVEQGTLSISASNHLGDSSITNTIRLANNAILQSTGANVDLGVNRNIALAGIGGTLEVTSTNRLTVSGAITGDDCHTLTKSGTGALILTNAANTFAGPTNVTGGTLQVGVSGTGQSGTGLITVSSGATLTGTGTIQGSVSLASGGTLQAGDVTTVAATPVTTNGTLTFTPTADFTAATGSTIRLDLTSATNTTIDNTWGGNDYGTPGWVAYVTAYNNQVGDHDRLVIGGNVTLAPGAEFVITSVGFTPMLGQIINFIDWAGITGFAAGATVRDGSSDGGVTDDLDLPDISTSGLSWDVSQFQSHGIVAVVPEPGRALLLLLGLSVLGLRRRRNGRTV